MSTSYVAEGRWETRRRPEWVGGWVGMVYLPSPAARQLARTLSLLLFYVPIYKNTSFLLNVKEHEVTQSLELLEILITCNESGS